MDQITLAERLREALFAAEEATNREHQLREKYDALLSGLHRFSQSTSIGTLLSAIGQTVTRHSGADIVVVLRGDPESGVFVPAYGWNSREPITLPDLPGAVRLLRKRPMLINDVGVSFLAPILGVIPVPCSSAIAAVLHEHTALFVLVAGTTSGEDPLSRNDLGFVADLLPTIRESLASRIGEEQLRDKERQLLQAQKLESIGQLAAGVAHEINTPVGFVQSNFHSLAEYVDALLATMESCSEADAPMGMTPDEFIKDVRSALTDSSAGLERIKTIVRSLRDFARENTGDDCVEAELNDSLEATLIVARHQTKHVLTIHLDLGDVPPVRCNVGQINQVFLNVIINASQAIASSSEKGNLWITSSHDNGLVTFCFADDGPGIPEAVIERVFDPFFTTKPEGEGTGLGLSVSADIINGHGGSLTAENGADGGARFFVRLPVNPPR